MLISQPIRRRLFGAILCRPPVYARADALLSFSAGRCRYPRCGDLTASCLQGDRIG